MGGIRPRGAGGTRWRFIPNLVMVFYLTTEPELFTDPAIVTFPTIGSLHVTKMIRLNLLCLVFIFSLPVPPWIKEKRSRHFEGFYSAIYFSVAFE